MYHRPKTDSKGKLVSVEFRAWNLKYALGFMLCGILENVLIEYYPCRIDAGIKVFVIAVIFVFVVASFKIIEQS